ASSASRGRSSDCAPEAGPARKRPRTSDPVRSQDLAGAAVEVQIFGPRRGGLAPLLVLVSLYRPGDRYEASLGDVPVGDQDVLVAGGCFHFFCLSPVC